MPYMVVARNASFERVGHGTHLHLPGLSGNYQTQTVAVYDAATGLVHCQGNKYTSGGVYETQPLSVEGRMVEIYTPAECRQVTQSPTMKVKVLLRVVSPQGTCLGYIVEVPE